jgi:hypothetical protein
MGMNRKKKEKEEDSASLWKDEMARHDIGEKHAVGRP